MSTQVDPSRVEELSAEYKRLNRTISDREPGLYREITGLIRTTNAQYPESYVQGASRRVESLLQDIRQLAEALTDRLDGTSKVLLQAAERYRTDEELARGKGKRSSPFDWLQGMGKSVIASFGAVKEAVSSAVAIVMEFLVGRGSNAYDVPDLQLPPHVVPLSSALSVNPQVYNNEVRLLQLRLGELGYTVDANGYYDSVTLAAVNLYKQTYGLDNHGAKEGVVDEKTWLYLFGELSGALSYDPEKSSNEVRMAQIRLQELGYPVDAMGRFTDRMLGAVNAFKLTHQLPNTGDWEGVLGPQTWKVLFGKAAALPASVVGEVDKDAIVQGITSLLHELSRETFHERIDQAVEQCNEWLDVISYDGQYRQHLKEAIQGTKLDHEFMHSLIDTADQAVQIESHFKVGVLKGLVDTMGGLSKLSTYANPAMTITDRMKYTAELVGSGDPLTKLRQDFQANLQNGVDTVRSIPEIPGRVKDAVLEGIEDFKEADVNEKAEMVGYTVEKVAEAFIPVGGVVIRAQKGVAVVDDLARVADDVPTPNDMRKRVLDNIGESKAARETSNFDKYLEEEKKLLDSIEQRKVEGTGDASKKIATRTFNSTYEERLAQTPVNNGKWTGERGESTFIHENEEVNEILSQVDKKGIDYSDAVPDFSSVSKGSVEIEGMSIDRDANFKKADELLAKKWGVTPKEVKKWRKQNKYTWHEDNDMKTMDLVPSVINSKFGHLGGVSEVGKVEQKLIEGEINGDD